MPSPRHGHQFTSVVLASNGRTYRNKFTFNGYEFKSPSSQAFHEATVICECVHASIVSVVMAPVLRRLVPINRMQFNVSYN